MFSELDSFTSWKVTAIKCVPLLHVRGNPNDMALLSGSLQLSYFIKTAVNLNWKDSPSFWGNQNELPISSSALHKKEEAAALLSCSKDCLNDTQEKINTRKCKGDPG